MLERLVIDNYSLLKHAEIDFMGGFNVISGETGAGKSLIIHAIGILAGQVSGNADIYPGSQYASIEGLFSGSICRLIENELQALQIDYKPNEELIFRVELHSKGRNRFLINDQIISKANYRIVCLRLVDLNSQHQNQRLLNERIHLEIFDEAVGIDCSKNGISEKYCILQKLTSEIEEIENALKRSIQRKQFLDYQIGEIESAGLKIGEKEDLTAQLSTLRFADEIKRNAEQAHEMLKQNSQSVSHGAILVNKALIRTTTRDSEWNDLASQSETLVVMIHELADEIERRMQKYHVSQNKLNEISERLHFLQQMEGKYVNNVEGMLKYRDELVEENERLAEMPNEMKQIERQWDETFSSYWQAATKLSEDRVSRASHLSRNVIKSLASLGMKNAQFKIEFLSNPDKFNIETRRIPSFFRDSGIDSLRFLLSANPGMPMKPIQDVASGGELSRIVMSLKQHFLSSKDAPIIILDEIDAGIGGQTAIAFGSELKRISNTRQLICVTHLSQIAVFAVHHISVTKSTDGVETVIEINALDSEQRIREVARMLSGQKDANEALAHAQAMIQATEKFSS